MPSVTAMPANAVDHYADTLTAVARALAASEVVGAGEHLKPIADELWHGHFSYAGPTVARPPAAKRGGIHDRRKAEVFITDKFHCASCGGRVIPRPVMVAISDIFAGSFAYHPNMLGGAVHPAYWALAPEVDHVLAHSRRGSSDATNLKTLHMMCNTQKADLLVEELPETEKLGAVDGWDDLVGMYPNVVAAGESFRTSQARSAYHSGWIKNFDIESN